MRKTIIQVYFFPIEAMRNMLDQPREVLQRILTTVLIEYADAHPEMSDDEIERAFGVLLGRSISQQRKNAPKYTKKQPYTHINKNRFWQIENRTRNSTQGECPSAEELVTLLAELGLKSMTSGIRNKDVKTTKEQLFARMQGYTSANEKGYEKDERITRYESRKLFEKLKRLVEEASGNIQFSQGHQRGVNFREKK